MAKLRLRTETTVTNLEKFATPLGNLLRKFKSYVCSIFATKELPSEEADRGRRKAAKVLKAGGEAERLAVEVDSSEKKKETRFRDSEFTMEVYKLHGLQATRQQFVHLESQRIQAPRMYVICYLLKISGSFIYRIGDPRVLVHKEGSCSWNRSTCLQGTDR
jgi:hypothetical protein